MFTKTSCNELKREYLPSKICFYDPKTEYVLFTSGWLFKGRLYPRHWWNTLSWLTASQQNMRPSLIPGVPETLRFTQSAFAWIAFASLPLNRDLCWVLTQLPNPQIWESKCRTWPHQSFTLVAFKTGLLCKVAVQAVKEKKLMRPAFIPLVQRVTVYPVRQRPTHVWYWRPEQSWQLTKTTKQTKQQHCGLKNISYSYI